MANMQLIEAKTVGAGGISAVEFTSIPQTFTDLRVLYSARTTNGSGYSQNLYMTFNNSTSVYNENLLYSAIGSPGATSKSNADPYLNWSSLGQGAETNIWASGQYYITNYRSTETKSISSEFVSEANNTSPWQMVNAGSWQPASNVAITSIKMTSSAGNVAEGSTFYLYGISNTIASGAKAYGGYVTEDSNYFYHTFLSTGVFTATQSLTADILVIAGGGGSQNDKGGGGGAGGISYLSGASLTATSYTCTVGAGGGGNANGSDSVWNSTVTSNGGGKGGTDSGGAGSGRNGAAGGSGGGASRNGSAGSANQGNTGGATGYGSNGGAGSEGTPTGSYSGGGGGGAGQAGQVPTGSTGGVGGNGLDTWSSWAIATNTGDRGYYAGGGGGQPYWSSGSAPGAAGGLGGGGFGGNWYEGANTYASGISGLANTGGGAGGGGASGGSGLIIVRYAK